MKISASGRGQFGPIWEMAYQHYVLRRGLPMPFTTRIVFGQKLSVVGRKQPCPYRPEPALPNTGICWGTLTAYRGKP
ncbi:MAG: hypothetical protein HYY25_12705 [Candidatus Wallbacteria bacterium]|nr:hypothetical protein [Candidatus Wallbacteria bacterium]